MKEYLLIVFSVFMLIACQGNQQPVVTPWGTTLTEDADTAEATGNFSLPDIIKNGELIMLTISGPETYMTIMITGWDSNIFFVKSLPKSLAFRCVWKSVRIRRRW